MNKKQSDRQLPEETRGFLGTIFLVPASAAVMFLAASLLSPFFSRLERVDVTRLFPVGLTASIVGVAFLFFAKHPLYKQRRSNGLVHSPNACVRSEQQANIIINGPNFLSKFNRVIFLAKVWEKSMGK